MPVNCDCLEEFEVVQIDLAALRMMDDWVNGEERGLAPEVVTIQRYDEWLAALKAEVARLGAA